MSVEKNEMDLGDERALLGVLKRHRRGQYRLFAGVALAALLVGGTTSALVVSQSKASPTSLSAADTGSSSGLAKSGASVTIRQSAPVEGSQVGGSSQSIQLTCYPVYGSSSNPAGNLAPLSTAQPASGTSQRDTLLSTRTNADGVTIRLYRTICTFPVISGSPPIVSGTGSGTVGSSSPNSPVSSPPITIQSTTKMTLPINKTSTTDQAGGSGGSVTRSTLPPVEVTSIPAPNTTTLQGTTTTTPSTGELRSTTQYLVEVSDSAAVGTLEVLSPGSADTAGTSLTILGSAPFGVAEGDPSVLVLLSVPSGTAIVTMSNPSGVVDTVAPVFNTVAPLSGLAAFVVSPTMMSSANASQPTQITFQAKDAAGNNLGVLTQSYGPYSAPS